MIGLVAEHILSYAKSFERNKAEGVGKLALTGDFSNPDNDVRGPWASKPWKAGSDQSGCRYGIVTPTGVKYDEEWLGEEKTYKSLLEDNRIYFPNNGKGSPRKKYFKSEREEEGQCATNWWTHELFGSNQGANALMTNLFGVKNKFSNPKPIELVKGVVQVTNRDYSNTVLDFFAGSGTTGHAVINLNREDKGNRKYILCEMAEYFVPVTKPRIEKVIYSEDWKDGKPVSRKGISQCFKYIRLEQYEDTLNNLQPKNQRLDFDNENGKGDFEETYFLRYMLDTETKGDLFNLEWFKNPFAMSIKTTKDNELIDTHVDMVETFNYLIGLNVETLRYPKDGYCVVEGTTHIGNERTLVIWRNCNKVNNEDLNEFFRKQAYCTTDSEFDKIYVNGDNTLPNIKTDEEHWKVVLIEEEFKKRMFE